MSRLRVHNLGVVPSTPGDSTALEVFSLSSDKKLRTIDGAGLVRLLVASGEVVNADVASGAAIESSKFNFHIGSSPPGSPTDGMFWLYRGTSPNNFSWLMAYNSSDGTYPWHFIGGGDLSSQAYTNTGAVFHGSGGWTQPFGTNPQVTLPRNGDYRVIATCTMYPAANGATWWMGLQIGGTNPTLDDAWVAGTYSPVSSARDTVTINTVGRGFAAGQTVAMVYQNNSAQNYTAYNRDISVHPVRIS